MRQDEFDAFALKTLEKVRQAVIKANNGRDIISQSANLKAMTPIAAISFLSNSFLSKAPSVGPNPQMIEFFAVLRDANFDLSSHHQDQSQSNYHALMSYKLNQAIMGMRKQLSQEHEFFTYRNLNDNTNPSLR